MKYQLPTEKIPQSSRQELNDKILYLIETDTCKENGITKQDVADSYTGKGALHNLNFNDFENYHEYSEQKKIVECGQFFTPAKICKFLVDCVKPSETDLIADLTYGHGQFFNFCPNEINCYGTEIDIPASKVAKYLYPDANLECMDIRLYDPKIKFDIVFGNPPFNLRFKTSEGEYLSQLYYFIKAAEVLKPAGILALIVPTSFLSDDFMHKKMIGLVDERFNFILQANLPKNAFKDVGVAAFETKVMFFQKKAEAIPEEKYKLRAELPVALNDASAERIHDLCIRPIMEAKRKVQAKILLETLSHSSENKDFQYRVKKYLFDIKNSKHTKVKYAKALNYVNEFYTQVKPPEMDYDEWEKIRITENKVIAYLKPILKNQHLVERDEIKLVKDNYGLRLKAYSRKAKLQLNKNYQSKQADFNDMVLNGNYSFDDLTYSKLMNRKNVRYQKSLLKFKDMDQTHLGEIEKGLKKSFITNHSTGEKITLTDMQRLDVASVIYKGKGILGWEMGSGKSLAAIFWYRHFKSQVKNTFICGPSIAIRLTWGPILTSYHEDHIMIDSLESISKIKPGQVVLISYDMLRKYERHIKRFIKINNRKISLVLDESDETTNATSKRTKVVLNCFRKVEKILETTGTTTRNNINELYSQIELLYNNSLEMLCTCPTIFKFNPKEDCIDEKMNDYYMKPFPAKYGNGLFKACFNPYKQTVFGIKKFNQDVYNSEHLVDLIERTIITRSFFEITGKKPQFETVRVKQNSSEEFVYENIINEFYKMVNTYFKSTGNSRKDRMLQILRQIQLLITATSSPESFREYNSSDIPGKEEKILEMVGEYGNEKVAIGTIFKEAADKYSRKLEALYPDRKVFLIKGETPFKKRKIIIADFEATKNGILVSTQGSLKSSVNIPGCNKVIVQGLPWNLPRLSQFYMRFVRFGSDIDNKKIFFVVYENSIEMNLLALLFSKQRLNDFIKHCEFQEQEDIFEDYGIDFGLIESIMEKVTETVEGKSKVKISWGKQNIA